MSEISKLNPFKGLCEPIKRSLHWAINHRGIWLRARSTAKLINIGRNDGFIYCHSLKSAPILDMTYSEFIESVVICDIDQQAASLISDLKPSDIISQSVSSLHPDIGEALFKERSTVTQKADSKLGFVTVRDKTLQIKARFVSNTNRHQEVLLSIEDVTDIRDHLNSLSKKYKYDELTHLHNRDEFVDDLLIFQKTDIKQATLALFDLKDTSYLNQAVGSKKVDEIIADLAMQVKSFSDHCGAKSYRISGDQMALIAINVEDQKSFISKLTSYFYKVLPGAYFQDQLISSQLSCGIASYLQGQISMENIFSFAEVALKKSKRLCIPYHIFDTDDYKEFVFRREVISQIQHAMDSGAIFPVYQTQNDLRSGEITSYEALARWSRPFDNWMMPEFFIPIIEESQFIHKFTTYMLNQVILDILEFGITKTVSINVSPQCLMVGRFSGEVEKILKRHNTAGTKICFEVTESTILIRSPIVEKNLEHLAELGIRLSIDDFGTGHSSISLLQNLRFSEIKMDRMFINQISVDPFAKAAIESTLMVANSLGVDMCVEGVETELERDWLTSKGCQIGQGYFYSKPLPAKDIFNTDVEGVDCSELSHKSTKSIEVSPQILSN